ALYEASRRGYTKVYFWPEATDWALRCTSFLGFATLALALLFILAVARLETIRIPGQKLFLAVIAFETITALLALLGDVYWVTQLTPLALLLYGISALACAIMLLRASVPGSRVMIIAGVFIASHTLLRVCEQIGWLPQYVSELGLHSPGTNPVLALARLGINIGVLSAWVIIIAMQRRDANNEI